MTPANDAPANFDPSDVFFQGWLLSRDAEKLKAEKKYVEAYEKILRAQKLFDSVSKFFPLWKPEMVKGRLARTTDFISAIGPEVVKENTQKNLANAEFEGGARAGVVEGEAPKPLDGLPTTPLPAQPVETLETRRIAELENRVKELQADLSRGGNPNRGDREASQARDIAKQRDLAQAELKRAHDELARLRARFAAEPMQEELRKLTDQLKDRDREKAALGQALNKSEGEVQALQAERVRLAQQVSDLQKNLADERKVQNEVIAGQQKQMRKMQEELRAKNDELAQANQKIASLENDLATIRSDFQDLKQERDDLLREKEQMAALLATEEGDRIQQLVDQNMGLRKQLREAEENLDRLNLNQNATQDQLLEAMTDLSIAKRNINDFKREKAAREKRIEELESRLRAESASLAANGTDPGEADMLRAIIQKQLRVQERRRQQTEILLEAVNAKAEKDEKIREAVELIQGPELVLSPQEMDLLKTRGVDDEFVSPFRRPRDQVDASVAKLEGENLPYIEAATRAYVKGKYQSARELCEVVLDSNPGDTATMCRLGNVHLRLEDPAAAARVFSNAVVIDSNNPFAHRMLGYSRMLTGEYGEALESLKRGVELAPTNAYGRVTLGKLLFDLGQEEEAEEQLKSAIIQDDAMWEPHFNLAFLYAKQGKKEQGLKYYQNALERGAAPDLALEKKLGK